MFHSYIWDFDGTLFDTYPIMLDGFIQALADYQINAEPKKIYRLLKEHSSKAVAETYQLDFSEFTERFHQKEAMDQRQPVVFPEVYDTLKAIIQAGGKNYILTHRTVASTKELLANAGMLEFFEEIVGPEYQFPRKPDPSAINYLVEKYHLPRESTVMVGDRPMDIDAGKSAGIKTCFYDIDYFLSEISADFTIHHMSEILTLNK